LELLDEDELLSLILPMDRVIETMTPIHLSDELSYYVRQGQAVLVPKSPTQGLVRLYTRQTMFMGVGEVLEDGRIAPRRLVKAAERTH